MKEISELFSNDFVLRMVNDINAIDFVENTKLEVLPADYEGTEVELRSNSSFEDLKKHVESKKHMEQNPPIKTMNGEIYIYGERYCVGNASYKVGIDKSVGKLISLPIYQQYGDDILGVYYPEYRGCVIVDKKLNVVYKQCSEPGKVYESPEDCLTLLYNFGPCALAFLGKDDLDKGLLNDIKATYTKRVYTLAKNGILEHKIENEQNMFEKCYTVLENVAVQNRETKPQEVSSHFNMEL